MHVKVLSAFYLFVMHLIPKPYRLPILHKIEIALVQFGDTLSTVIDGSKCSSRKVNEMMTSVIDCYPGTATFVGHNRKELV